MQTTVSNGVAGIDTEFGCEIRCRHWFGDTGRKEESPDAEIITLVTDTKFSVGMIALDLEGMKYLERFLPTLYEEQK